MKTSHILGLSFALMTASGNAALSNYVITGYAALSGPIVSTRPGSTTVVNGANPLPAGSPVNTTLVSAGVFVDFTIGDATSLNAIPIGNQTTAMLNALPTVATLRVSLNSISAGGTELMIARTSDSQGLTDAGTITLLLTGLDGVNVNTQVNFATFGFEWRNAANTGLLGGSDQKVFTSYDLDFGQRNIIPTADIAVYGLSTPTTGLVVTTPGSNTIFRDGPPTQNTSVADPLGAYAFATFAGDNTQTISVDKTDATDPTSGNAAPGGNQLYMFSFRSPSPLITVVPEPSSAIIAGLGALALLRRRRD